MGRKLDLLGKKFGRLDVISEYAERKGGRVCWICRCECGNLTSVSGSHLTAGEVKSCGCLRGENLPNPGMGRLKHGACSDGEPTPLYSVWVTMKNRCYDRKATGYQYYGKRWIHVCDEWISNFVAFKDWAVANGYEKGLCIHRIDNESGYAPDNCVWLPRREHMILHHQMRGHQRECRA